MRRARIAETLKREHEDFFTVSQASTAGDFDQNSLAQQLRNCKSLEEGRWIHSRISGAGGETETFLGNCIVQMYGKWGCCKPARALFDRISYKNVFSWTIMISAYTRNGDYREAFVLFRRMDLEGQKPHAATFVSLVSACIHSGSLKLGREFHERISWSGLDSCNVVLGSALIDMYGKLGCSGSARKAFERIRNRNTASWNALISAYTRSGEPEKALELYGRMKLEDEAGVEPNIITIVSVLDACCSCKALDEGRKIHSCISGCIGFESDVVVGTALVNMYGKCGSLSDAMRVFDSMPCRNLITWNALISAFVHGEKRREALELYGKMKASGVQPNIITFTSILGACVSGEFLEDGRALHSDVVLSGAGDDPGVAGALVNMFSKCGSPSEAEDVFDRSPGMRSLICWTSIISAHAQGGNDRRAFLFYWIMSQEGIKPDAVTLLSVSDACRSQIEGKLLHARAEESGFNSEIVLGNSFIKMFSRCGSLSEARRVFQTMSRRNTCSWNSMIGACVENGENEEALKLYRAMDSDLDEITFINVLAACCRLEDGEMIHRDIARRNLESRTLNSIINMYSRCSSLDSARKVFEEAQMVQHRDVVTWNSMIGACVQQGSFDEAMELFNRMDVKPSRATFATILTCCCELGALENGRKIHSAIVESGLESDETLASKLLLMYGKCGKLDEALRVFQSQPRSSSSAWTGMITALSRHGRAAQAFELLFEQELEGVEPEEQVFLSLLSGCSHAGLVKLGLDCFSAMAEHGVGVKTERFNCVVDLLSRAGWLDKVEQMIEEDVEICSELSWITVLAACGVHNELRLASLAAERIVIENGASQQQAYVLLSNNLQVFREV